MYERNTYPTSLGFLVFFLFTLLLQQTCIAQKQQACAPSSCGKITNISHPFRLKHDPPNCGNPRYELTCENNITVLYLGSGKYYVQSINYNNYTIRLVDSGVQHTDCSSIPRYFSYPDNYSEAYDTYRYSDSYALLFQHIIYLNCSNLVSDDPKYVDTASCINWNSQGHFYAIAGDIMAERLKVDCRVMLIATTTLWGSDDYPNSYNERLSYSDIHRALIFGFEVSWVYGACIGHCEDDCYFRLSIEMNECSLTSGSCYSPWGYSVTTCGKPSKLRVFVEGYFFGVYKGLRQIGGRDYQDPNQYHYSHDNIDLGVVLGVVMGQYILPYVAARFLFGLTILFSFLIYKWRRRHLSMYGNIEDFLKGNNNLMPIRYSYKDIKKMTTGFRDKLGEGGFGTVYKGKLRSGPFAAVKMLGKAKANGQEFISEVATIGRIHHVNVVQLVGFCFEGSKRALVYEFMPNGSLDKYLFSKESSIFLNYEKMYEISLGVARGIAYLHQGCDMQILHFDIKPHNILLDENFIPKVSDFGLAKLYPVDDSIVTLTAARGTIGYMAPELFYKNIGGVSYKADVYSFGMLLMEMTSRRKNLNPHAEHSSQLYFPFWIYDQFNEKKDIEIEDITEEEKHIAKKMFIVALWCIQLKPCDRPSMNKVVEMLEGEIESLEMPPKPTLYPHETIAEDGGMNSGLEASSDFTDSNTYLQENATDPLMENSAC